MKDGSRRISKSFSGKKEKKRQYHRGRNKNLFEEAKANQVEYMRNYYLAHKN